MSQVVTDSSICQDTKEGLIGQILPNLQQRSTRRGGHWFPHFCYRIRQGRVCRKKVKNSIFGTLNTPDSTCFSSLLSQPRLLTFVMMLLLSRMQGPVVPFLLGPCQPSKKLAADSRMVSMAKGEASGQKYSMECKTFKLRFKANH